MIDLRHPLAVLASRAVLCAAGYNQALLDEYRPNETYYLSQAIRDELRSQGQAVSRREFCSTRRSTKALVFRRSRPWPAAYP